MFPRCVFVILIEHLAVGLTSSRSSYTDVAAADRVVRIPMHHGVDSLNVVASAAVAMWALR